MIVICKNEEEKERVIKASFVGNQCPFGYGVPQDSEPIKSPDNYFCYKTITCNECIKNNIGFYTKDEFIKECVKGMTE